MYDARNKQDLIPPGLDMAVLERADLTVVPGKPTGAMLASGAAAGDVSIDTAWRIYRAMIQSVE